MRTDEPMLTQAERRSAEALRIALHEIAEARPIRVDSNAFTAPVPRPRVFGARLPMGLAAAMAIVLMAATVVVAWPRGGAAGTLASPSRVPTEVPTEGPTLPGTAGHFDNGEMSFDYPSDWPVLAAQVPESCGIIYVLAVLGTGSWDNGANQPQSNGAVLCGIDTVTVSPGGVVVRIYWRGGGPAPMCLGYTTANATVGPNAVQKTTDGLVTSWEIRLPGGEFRMPNDPIFEVHTSDPALLAKAEAMVASFRWSAGAPSYVGLCSPSPEATTAI